MTTTTALVGTWSDGVFVVGKTHRQELAGQCVRGLAADGRGGTLAIVDGHSLQRRSALGDWTTIATNDLELACVLVVGSTIYVGTDDGAHILRVTTDGGVEQLSSFDAMIGRDEWFAGSALVNGQLLGPPLGVRSLASTADGRVILANIHVGGIARSTDSGSTWQPTMAVTNDVHEVRAHPRRAAIAMAAAGNGLWVSRDAGATWSAHNEGLHATYCSAVAFCGDDLLVAASTDHFATQGALYRRPIADDKPLTRVGGGLPAWFDGIVDTSCIATHDEAIAVTDHAGNVCLTEDSGHSWSRRASGLPIPSSVLFI